MIESRDKTSLVSCESQRISLDSEVLRFENAELQKTLAQRQSTISRLQERRQFFFEEMLQVQTELGDMRNQVRNVEILEKRLAVHEAVGPSMLKGAVEKTLRAVQMELNSLQAEVLLLRAKRRQLEDMTEQVNLHEKTDELKSQLLERLREKSYALFDQLGRAAASVAGKEQSEYLLHELKTHIDNLKSTGVDSEASAKRESDLISQFDKANETITNLKEEMACLVKEKEKTAQLEGDVEVLKLAVSTSKLSQTRLQDQVEDLNEQLMQLSTHSVHELQMQVTELQLQVETLTVEITKIEEEKENLMGTRDAEAVQQELAQKFNEEFEVRISHLQGLNRQLTVDNEKLSLSVKNLQEQVDILTED